MIDYLKFIDRFSILNNGNKNMGWGIDISNNVKNIKIYSTYNDAEPMSKYLLLNNKYLNITMIVGGFMDKYMDTQLSNITLFINYLNVNSYFVLPPTVTLEYCYDIAYKLYTNTIQNHSDVYLDCSVNKENRTIYTNNFTYDNTIRNAYEYDIEFAIYRHKNVEDFKHSDSLPKSLLSFMLDDRYYNVTHVFNSIKHYNILHIVDFDMYRIGIYKEDDQLNIMTIDKYNKWFKYIDNIKSVYSDDDIDVYNINHKLVVTHKNNRVFETINGSSNKIIDVISKFSKTKAQILDELYNIYAYMLTTNPELYNIIGTNCDITFELSVNNFIKDNIKGGHCLSGVISFINDNIISNGENEKPHLNFNDYFTNDDYDKSLLVKANLVYNVKAKTIVNLLTINAFKTVIINKYLNILESIIYDDISTMREKGLSISEVANIVDELYENNNSNNYSNRRKVGRRG